MSDDKKKNDYSADSIQALEGIEHVRMSSTSNIALLTVRHGTACGARMAMTEQLSRRTVGLALT